MYNKASGENLILFTFRNINSIDVKIAKTAVRFMDTASAAHPYVLSDIVAPLPYEGKHNLYLLSVDFSISKHI